MLKESFIDVPTFRCHSYAKQASQGVVSCRVAFAFTGHAELPAITQKQMSCPFKQLQYRNK